MRCADRTYTVNLSGNHMQVKALQCCWKKIKLLTKKRARQTFTELTLLLFHANLEAKNELRISFRNLCWIFVNYLERGRCLVHEWFLHCLDNFKFLSQNWTNIIWFIAGLNHRFHMLLTMQWSFDIQLWYLGVLMRLRRWLWEEGKFVYKNKFLFSWTVVLEWLNWRIAKR